MMSKKLCPEFRQEWVREFLELGLKMSHETSHAAFIWYSGHVDSITVKVTKAKRPKPGKKAVNLMYEDIYMDVGNEDETVAELTKAYNKMSGIWEKAKKNG
jgi:hypothetical protein